MIKVSFLAFAFCIAYAIGTAQFNYVLTTSMEPYADLTGSTSVNNGEVWDDPDYTIPLPFAFELNGEEISSLTFVGSGSDLGTEISPDFSVAMSPFSVDLIDRGVGTMNSQSPISYKVEGSPGNRIFKIEWKNAGSFDEFDDLGTTEMFVNFQVWLFEGSNRVEFHYGPSSITDADLFYLGETGAIVAIASIDFNLGGLFNANFLTGPTSNPILTDMESYIDGTPEDGMVYILSVNLPLDVEVIGVDGTCGLSNGSASANPSGGVEPYTYDWSNGATTQTISDLQAGSYTVTVTDASGATASGVVNILNVDPVVANAGATDETASNANDGTANAAPFGGTPSYSFDWSNGSTTQMISGLAPGVYTVTVTDSEGCTDVQSVTVNAFGCPDLLLEAALSNINCFGACDVSIEILEVIQGTPPFTYEWNTGSTESFIADICAGEYTVTVTDANGCVVSDIFQVFQPDELFANASSTNETSQGASDGTASAAPTGGIEPYTFEWSNGGATALITGLSPGSYTVIVSDANFCTDTQTVMVNSAGCVLSLSSVVDNASCFESCDGSITITPVNATPPVSYSWSNGSTDALIGNLCAGNYSVTIEDGTGCSFTAGFEVVAPPELLANAASSDESAQGANDGSAWVTPSGGTPPYTYAWSNGSTDSLITGLIPGEYAVLVTDANGCVGVQAVTVNAFACVSLIESAITPVSCFGSCDGAISFVVLDGIGPFTYEWSTGDTTTSITDLCSGTYSVTIHDEGQNCSGIAGFFLGEPDPVIMTIDDVTHITDSTTSSIAISVTGGTQPYTYLWSGPDGFVSTADDISGMDAGLYTVTVTDANGCTAILDSIEIRDETVGVSDILKLDVRVYPNPTNGQVHIEVLDATEFEVQLRTLDGRIVETWNTTKAIDVSRYSPGIYVMECISGEKQYSCRLIITR